MSSFKCKMCGAELDVKEGQTVATCSYCGSKQTVANPNDERKKNLFNRANSLRINCEFDKAILTYQSILSIFPNEPEAYWGLTLCKYGIEYVDDPITKTKKPTIHRMSFESLLKDSDYIRTLEYADVIAKEEYEAEAKEIADIQKNILSISQKEEPFDIFICYKESDEKGKRTPDSVMAQEIYDKLIDKGYKVFFSRVSLENKLGTMYEPYIFAALNSAKLMLVIGTKKQYFEAVWVKNEWSRFIDLMQNRPDHYLIPCYKDMDAYEMPEEFLSFQAQDLSKLGFMQDLIRGIDKIMGKDIVATRTETKIITTDVNVNALLKRSEILIGDGDYDKADGLLEIVLNNDPINSQAYLLKLVIELELKNIDELKNQEVTLEGYSNFQKAFNYANEEQRKRLKGINEYINNRNEEKRLSELYDTAMEYKNNRDFLNAVKAFSNIANYRDAKKQAVECIKLYNEDTYESAIKIKDNEDYDDAIELFSQIIDFKDSKEQIEECKQLKINAQKETIYKSCLFERKIVPSLDLFKLKKSCESLSTILGYKDSEQLLIEYERIIKDYELKLAKQKEEKRRIKAIRRKKFKKISIISGITAAVFTGIILLVFLFLIPQSRQNNIQTLLNQKRYDEAYSLIEENGEYGDTKNLFEMYKAGKAFETLDYESGINYIYNIGGTIDVTYDANGGTLSKDHETIKSLKHIDNEPIEKEGYTFYGWKQVDYSIDSKNHYATVNLRAEYEPINYQLTFDLDGGTYPETLPSYYNVTDSIILANPTKTGYSFIGWTGLNETKPIINYILREGSIGNKHFKANWKANNYIINIDLNTGNMGETAFEVTYDSEYALTEPTKVGYDFVGYIDENGDAFSSTGVYKFDRDITLIAQWQAKLDIQYKVYYYLENIDNEIFTYDSYDNMYGIADKSIVVRAKQIEGFTPIEDSKTITIKPDGSSVVNFYYSRNTYSLSFVTNGGSSVDDITLKYEEELPSNIKTTRDGYTFDGWYYEVGQTNKFFKMPAHDTNAYAYYSEETRAMNFDVSYNDGEAKIIKYNYLFSSKIVIPLYINGNLVTEISDGAFSNCLSLTDVTIPSSVIEIGFGAFKNCKTLEKITLPFIGSSSDTTGDNAKLSYIFGEKIPSNLRELVILEGCTSIEDYAFSGCSSLANITIPSDITKIGTSAFANCTSLENVYYEGTIEEWCNITFDNEYSNPMSYANKFYKLNNNEYEEITSIEIPETITSIGKYQFYGFSNLISVRLSNGVTTIGEYAFYNCSSLKKITLPFVGTSQEATGDSAKLSYIFGGTVPSSLKQVVILEECTAIKDDAFRNCASLTNITIPSSITKIGNYAFSGCTLLTNIIVPSDVTSIGRSAFANCTSLERLTLPFVGASQGATDNNAKLSYIFGGTVPSSLKKVVILDGCVSIGDFAFENCVSLTSIALPSTIETIGYGAFSNCTSLTNVYYVGTIEEWCNIKFSNIYSTPMSYANKFYKLNSNNEYEEVTSIEIQDTVTSIGNYQFYGFNNLTSITLPSSVEIIGYSAVKGCSMLKKITLPFVGSSQDATGDNAKLSYIFGGTVPNSLKEVIILEGCTSIRGWAFSGCSSLNSITLPNSVTTIGEYAFSDCSSLKKITLPFVGASQDATEVSARLTYIFGWMVPNSLKEVIILEGCTSISGWAFSGCSSLNSITLPNSVTTIGEYAFSDCSSLTSITIPNSVTTIGEYAFFDCSSLTSITIPNSVTTIGEYAFYDCNLLTIYCQLASKPENWHSKWNGGRPVIWNYKS
ncbi:MAG: leucine-rich repeat protein [Erysipelotrichaceae bacterium]|nr:leucine-rich repeat protein [Erysipelotrichaceae bacterium]